MLIRLGYEMVFQVPAPTPMLLMLYVHPSRAASLRGPDRVRVEPDVAVREFTDTHGNRCGWLAVPPGRVRLSGDAVIEVSCEADPVLPGLTQLPVEDLPPKVLPFLLGSRYCEVDALSDDAWSLFGGAVPGGGRVQAVCDWVHANVRFGYEFADPRKGALETFRRRAGVCRDLNHLALTFCRCLGVPARYVTGYLGDFGVPPSSSPMDFSGWFEAYLGGGWRTFDARHNVPRMGRVEIARGRDAVDVAMTTSFGPTTLEAFRVVTQAES